MNKHNQYSKSSPKNFTKTIVDMTCHSPSLKVLILPLSQFLPALFLVSAPTGTVAEHTATDVTFKCLQMVVSRDYVGFQELPPCVEFAAELAFQPVL